MNMIWKKLNSVVEEYLNPVYKKTHPVMALATVKHKNQNGYYEGIIREIIGRKGDVSISGFVDRSKLFIVKSSDGLKWKRVKELKIEGINEIIKKLSRESLDFIGLEDPDIWVENGKIHVYFSIAYKRKNKRGYFVALGHAQGSSLFNLTATKPVMIPKLSEHNKYSGFKEVAINPLEYNGYRINLCESGYHDFKRKVGVSTIVSVKAKDLSKTWKLIKTVGDPPKFKWHWCNGQLSPTFILPKKLISYKDYLVVFINGRSQSKRINNKTYYGDFETGLALFNPKTGEIPWISPEPFVADPEEKSITFTSDYLPINKNEILLYAHTDDSFIRAYKINLKELKKLIDY